MGVEKPEFPVCVYFSEEDNMSMVFDTQHEAETYLEFWESDRDGKVYDKYNRPVRLVVDMLRFKVFELEN